MSGLQIIPVAGVPRVDETHHVPTIVVDHARPTDGDVIVVTSKIVSKAEGRVVELDRDDAEGRRRLIASESVRVLRRRGDLYITETRHGFVCANAGIDFSNIEDGRAVLLPLDPDRSARKVRDFVRAHLRSEIAVVISDTFGRTWRRGATDVAIGSAGLRPVLDLRDSHDSYGNTLRSTEICLADEIAAAAELVMRKTLDIPIAVVKGVDRDWFGEGSVREHVTRRHGDDLFR